MEEFSKIMANSLSSDINLRRNAEETIEGIVLDSSTLSLFFNYIASPNVNISLKQAGAVILMRYIKDYWYDDSSKSMSNPHKCIQIETKQIFKENILNLMMSVDAKIIPTLKETIVSICKEGGGYSNSWPELMSFYGNILKNKNFQISVDIYDIIFQIIKRYRYEFKSYALFEEIKATISEIAPAMTEDGITCINFFFSDEKSNREMCILYLTLIKHIINIFISLNFQDFPEFFEDNLKSWIGILKGSLDFSMGIPSNDRVLNSLFIKVKKVAMKALNLYCNNYYEDIIQSHNDFLPSVWNLLNLIKHDETYAKLIREILDYYKILFQYKRTVGFESSTIQHLINNLIIPEMRMTNKEMDDFEDNPINFLKIELEEADMDSNKYHAINLLKNLINIYSNLTNDYINPLIKSMLDKYYKNPESTWMDKIVSINLIFATMIKTFAQKIGATEIKTNIEEISGLIELVFLKEFQTINKPILLARIYSLKFLSTFRLQIPQNWLNSIINMLIEIMKSSDKVTQTACLLTLEKILFMRDLNTNTSLVRDAVNDQTTFIELISNLVKISSSNINIFAMRCLFRTVFLTSESYYQPIIESLSNSINDILKMVIANPSEDEFNYYLFEIIAMILRKLDLNDKSLYNYFSNVLKQNLVYIIENTITDLIGYVFQIFSLELYLLPINDGPVITDQMHSSILNSILFENSNWTLQMKYMFNPLVSYVKVSIMKCKSYYASNKRNLDQLFVIIDKLLNLKSYTVTFELIDFIINYFDFNLIYDHIKILFYNFMLVYNNLKLNNKKAHREFSKILIVFLAKVLIKTSSKTVIELIEVTSQGLTVVLLTELSEFIQELDNNKNKKLVTYAYCSIISDFFSAFDAETLRLFTWRLIQHLERFYKVNINNLGSEIDKLLEPGQDLSYAANNYNKIYNADIKIEIDDYSKIYLLDENQIFYNTMNTVKNSINLNLIGDVFNNLRDKEKEYVQISSKNYSK